MVNQNGTDYVALARAAGIANCRNIDTTAKLERALPEIIAAPGPCFTVLRVEAETEFLGTPPMPYEGPEMKYRLYKI